MAKIETWMKLGWAALVAGALAAGCETASMDNQGPVSLAELQGITTATADTNAPAATETAGDSNSDEATDEATTDEVVADGTTTTNSLWPAEITGKVKFLNTDVSSWPETASLHASVSGSGNVSIPYSKANVWPGVDGVNANPWVFVNLGGQWYAATWDGHIKVSPLSSWEPSSGERFGLMVSGLVRGGLSNVKERSNVSMVTWP